MGQARLFQALALLGTLTGLSGCFVDKQSGATLANYPLLAGNGLATFKAQVHPYLRANCAACHGATQSPLFALASAESAYPNAKSVVNFSDLPSSTIMSRIRDGHCGAACSGDGSALLKLLQAWQAAEQASGNNSTSIGKIVTPDQPVPANLPVVNITTGQNINSFVRMRWDLGQTTPANPDLVGAVLELEIQLYAPPTDTTPGVYRVRKPRVGSPTNTLYVQDIKVLVNKTLNPANNEYAGIETVIAAVPGPYPSINANNLPFPVLSPELMLLEQMAPSGDQISVSFERLEKGTAASCKALDSFVTNVKSVMTNKCFSCHQGGNSTAQAHFNMSGTDDQVCARALQRVDLGTPTDSALINYPMQLRNLGHPTTTMNASDQDAFITWIDSEK